VSDSCPRAAVLVPTHDHAGTLELAVRSALEQTVAELEVIVVGDGVGEDTREVVGALREEDPRVRFLDLPKGPHHGEPFRGTAVEGTEAEIVCYLCDDDLLLPDHVEQMLALLAEADFAHSMNGWFDVEGAWHNYWADLASPRFRAWMLEPGDNAVSLTGAAHTVAAYRRLPHGWRVPPYGYWPDQYMWQQFLAQPWVRAVTGPRVTALQFPSHVGRDAWPAERRRGELEQWRTEIATPEGRRRLQDLVGRAVSREASAEWLWRRKLESDLAKAHGEAAAERWRAHLEVGALRGKLDEIESTRTWRLRTLLKRWRS
jgi:glycosyltransferase involved in cell wall biosynthesis